MIDDSVKKHAECVSAGFVLFTSRLTESLQASRSGIGHNLLRGEFLEAVFGIRQGPPQMAVGWPAPRIRGRRTPRPFVREHGAHIRGLDAGDSSTRD